MSTYRYELEIFNGVWRCTAFDVDNVVPPYYRTADDPIDAFKGAQFRANGPNNDEVICPHCEHEFREIPVNVQAMLRAAGFVEPFTQTFEKARPPRTEINVKHPDATPKAAAVKYNDKYPVSDFHTDTYSLPRTSGFAVPKVGVRVTHTPTGFTEESGDLLTEYRNRSQAISRLMDRLDAFGRTATTQPVATPDTQPTPEPFDRSEDYRVDEYMTSRLSGFAPLVVAVRVTHTPSGISEECHSEPSRWSNKALAFQRVRQRVSAIGRTDDPRRTKTV